MCASRIYSATTGFTCLPGRQRGFCSVAHHPRRIGGDELLLPRFYFLRQRKNSRPKLLGENLTLNLTFSTRSRVPISTPKRAFRVAGSNAGPCPHFGHCPMPAPGAP